MELSNNKTTERIKAIMKDIEPVISKDYTKENGFACAFVFNNLFDECCELMKNILLLYYGYKNDSNEVKNPRSIVSASYGVGLIGSEKWMKMLLDRNSSVNDYLDCDLENYFNKIKSEYFALIKEFSEKADYILKNKV